MMTCDEVLEQLDGRVPGAEVNQHLQGCEACRQTAEALSLASLPPLEADARAALSQLPDLVMAEWQTRRAPPVPAWLGWARMALAAGVGAFISASVLRAPTRLPQAERSRGVTLVATTAAEPTLALPEQTDEPNLPDDEVFFDVSWPGNTSTEGEL
jgi:predicted anti-sigma-YlaC factor YlaD